MKIPENEQTQKERLLFFDILRILCVAAIVYDHSQYALVPWFNNLFFASGNLPFNIYTLGLQGWAVFGMIFVSGAVLEYTYQGLGRARNYSGFLFRRFTRLYPAFWMSLAFGLLLNVLLTISVAGQVIRDNFFLIIFEYTGFFVVLGKGPGFINNMGWFIAAIVCLYLLYPYISEFIRKYRLAAVFLLLIISFASRSFFQMYPDLTPVFFYRWFPLCNLFEFGLGIFIIQADLYPATGNSSALIRKLADLSFYVFLFHTVVIAPLLVIIKTNPDLADITWFLGAGMTDLRLTLYYGMLLAIMFAVSWAAMIVDGKLQDRIRKSRENPPVRKPSKGSRNG